MISTFGAVLLTSVSNESSKTSLALFAVRWPFHHSLRIICTFLKKQANNLDGIGNSSYPKSEQLGDWRWKSFHHIREGSNLSQQTGSAISALCCNRLNHLIIKFNKSNKIICFTYMFKCMNHWSVMKTSSQWKMGNLYRPSNHKKISLFILNTNYILNSNFAVTINSTLVTGKS